MPLTLSPDICLTGIRQRGGTSPSSKTLQTPMEFPLAPPTIQPFGETAICCRRRPESLARESRAAVCCFHWPCDRKSARPAGRFLSHRFRTFEHGGRPEIVVLKDDLVEIRIHRDRTVNRIPVGDRADRRTSDIDCRAGILRCGLNGSLL